jgi:hypothetical protein
MPRIAAQISRGSQGFKSPHLHSQHCRSERRQRRAGDSALDLPRYPRSVVAVCNLSTHPLRRQTVRSRSHPGSGRWSCRSRIRRDGQTRPSWPCACPLHRHAPRSHRCRHRGRGRERADTQPRDTGTSTPRTLDSGCVDTCADTGRSPGHRTPDAGTRGRVDAWTRPSTWTGPPRHGGTGLTSWTTTTTRLHTGPPNRGPVDGAYGAGNDEGSATVRFLCQRRANMDHLAAGEN